MDRLVNTAITAMRGTMARQTTIANNLANVNTVGFREEIANAETRWIKGGTFNTRAQASEQVVASNMNAGAIIETGNPLDVAIEGDALLAVQGTDGTEAYTRRGDLKISASRLLTTGDGMPVHGEGGPITLPDLASVTIAKDGSIWGVPKGGDAANPQRIDKLKLVSPIGSSVAKGTDGLFRDTNKGILPVDPFATVISGSVEGSNVNATASLVAMIEASRAWETQVKMLDSAKQMDDGGASVMKLD